MLVDVYSHHPSTFKGERLANKFLRRSDGVSDQSAIKRWLIRELAFRVHYHKSLCLPAFIKHYYLTTGLQTDSPGMPLAKLRSFFVHEQVTNSQLLLNCGFQVFIGQKSVSNRCNQTRLLYLFSF